MELPPQAQVPQPPAELFVRQNRKNTTGEKTRVYLLEKIDCTKDKGILVYRVGATYPEKGWPTPESLYALNQVKRLIREFLELCKSPLIAIGVLLYNKNKLLDQFNILFDKIYEVHTLKIDFLCPTAIATFQFLSGFLKDCGYDKDISEQFAFRFAQILEKDDAYRYRVQDLATSYEPQNATGKELKRIEALYWEREHEYSARPKVARVIKIIRHLLLIPKYRKAFEKNKHFIKGMVLDEGDIYWTSLRSEYDYNGQTYESKQEGLIKPTQYEGAF